VRGVGRSPRTISQIIEPNPQHSGMTRRRTARVQPDHRLLRDRGSSEFGGTHDRRNRRWPQPGQRLQPIMTGRQNSPDRGVPVFSERFLPVQAPGRESFQWLQTKTVIRWIEEGLIGRTPSAPTCPVIRGESYETTVTAVSRNWQAQGLPSTRRRAPHLRLPPGRIDESYCHVLMSNPERSVTLSKLSELARRLTAQRTSAPSIDHLTRGASHMPADSARRVTLGR
jgi:hypothetical protein